LTALVADLLGKANFKNWTPIERPTPESMEKKRRAEQRRRFLVERFEARQRATGSSSPG
jgi:hypothetical protein